MKYTYNKRKDKTSKWRPYALLLCYSGTSVSTNTTFKCRDSVRALYWQCQSTNEVSLLVNLSLCVLSHITYGVCGNVATGDSMPLSGMSNGMQECGIVLNIERYIRVIAWLSVVYWKLGCV